MFKRVLSVLLASLMLTAGITTVSATEEANTTQTNEEKVEIRKITPVVKNNITTYYDQDGNEVDITANNRQIDVDEDSLPSSYDLRDEGRVTSVKNQGNEGFCWNFASTASIESSILTNPELRAELGENPEKKLDLSEAGNAWYIHTSIEDEDSYLYDDYYRDYHKGSKGGTDTRIAMGLSSGYGAYPEELMPYDTWGNRYPESYRFYSDYRLKDFNILENDVALIKQLLIKNGAIYLSYSNNGLTEDVNGMSAYFEDQTVQDFKSGHAVTIVGWDDNFSREYFNENMRPENDGAWLIKNSWGEDSGCTAEGYEGYFWMSYESVIRDLSQFTVQGVDEFDNIYQHQFSTNQAISVRSASNVFIAENDEVLKQISFANYGSADFNVEVYKLNDNFISPVDGELLTSFEDSVDFTGTHCIEVPNDVILNSGDTFSVVIKSDDYIDIDINNRYDILPNKSYFVLEDEVWFDSCDNFLGYSSIKALTSNKDNTVYKDELSQLVDTVEDMEIRDDVPQEYKNKLSNELENAKVVLNDNTATQNTVDNTYCLLCSAKEAVDSLFYQINSMEDFINLHQSSLEGKYLHSNIQLNTDLDFSGYEEMKPLFYMFRFTGSFNGNGHTISNLKITNEGLEDNENESTGLFSALHNAKIEKLNLDRCTFKLYSENGGVGAIAGEINNSFITNCTVSNSEILSMNTLAGGIAIRMTDSTVSNCQVKSCKIISCAYGKGSATGVSPIVENTKIENVNLSQNEIVGTGTVSNFVSYLPEDSVIQNCVAKECILKSFTRIVDSNNIVFNYTECGEANSYIVLKDGKYTLEPYFGTITSVTSEEAVLTQKGDIYEIDLNGNTEVNLNVSYDEIDVGYFTYTYDMFGSVELTGYYNYEDESATDIVIPSTIGGLPVTSMSEDFAFESVAPIKSLTISGNMKEMNTYVFSRLEQLETVIIDEGVKTIGNGVFSGCINLTSIKLPDSLESVGVNTFSGCGSLSIILGRNIDYIGMNAFGYTGRYDSKNKNIPIPDFTIVGYKDTEAEVYASKNGFKFVDITSPDAEIPQGSFDYGVFKKGDVNLDGQVTIADATLIQKYLVGKAEFNDIQKCNAIIHRYNPSITIENATYIQKSLVGLATL